MIVVWVLLFIVAAVLGYFFFAPFYLEINTISNIYRVRFHRLAHVSLKRVDNSLTVEIKIAWWRKQLDLFSNEERKQPAPVKEKKMQKKKRYPSWKKIKGVLRSFRVRKCIVVLDSGDMQLNGLLYPVLYFARVRSGHDIRISFTGENVFVFELKNSLARMSWAYISS